MFGLSDATLKINRPFVYNRNSCAVVKQRYRFLTDHKIAIIEFNNKIISVKVIYLGFYTNHKESLICFGIFQRLKVFLMLRKLPISEI